MAKFTLFTLFTRFVHVLLLLYHISAHIIPKKENVSSECNEKKFMAVVIKPFTHTHRADILSLSLCRSLALSQTHTHTDGNSMYSKTLIGDRNAAQKD